MITAEIKLVTTAGEKTALLDLLRCVNVVRNRIAQAAFDAQCFSKFRLQKLLYHDLRLEFPALTANHFIRALASVAASYKTTRAQRTVTQPIQFRDTAGIELDDKLWRWAADGTISLSVSQGYRPHLPYRAGQRQFEQLQHATHSAKLVYRRGEFYLQIACNAPEKDAYTPDGFLGVDLGIVKVAVDSDGDEYNAAIEPRRRQISDHRTRLQRCGTKSAKRRLKRVAGQQARFQRDVNHVISKRLVEKAKDTQRGIALEDLTGIRKRTGQRLRKSQRARHSNWSFHQLRFYVEYKAQHTGVPVVLVDPRYTSQRCSSCGHVSKANRPSQSEFRCVACGFEAHADHNAAVNITRAAVSPPIVAAAPPAA
ncbi:MAG: transposase [Anaerolineae bacterium]|nr:transposase [Anaerolineae bacterium]